MDLRAHLVELVAAQAEALRDVPARVVGAPEPQHVAVGDDPLILRPERRPRVRVLGELEDRVEHAQLPA
jgi:hypothetical protein